MPFGCFEDVHRAGDVVRIVLQRQLRALTNGFEGGKMDDAVNGPTFCNPFKRRKQCRSVGTIHLLYLGLKS